MLSLMDKILFLKRTTAFSGMSHEQLQIMSSITTEEEYAPGEIIFYENEPGDAMYIIISGEIQIIEGIDSNRVILATMEKGDLLGELAVLDDEFRSASAKAVDDVLLLSIKKEEFRELIREYPDLSFEIFKVLNQRIRNVNEKLQEIKNKLEN